MSVPLHSWVAHDISRGGGDMASQFYRLLWLRWSIGLTAAVLLATRPAGAQEPRKGVKAEKPAAAELLKSDSRAPYVHRLTLYDHAGKAIDPNDKNPVPYSPATTCAKCHPYAQIAHGWHFNAWDKDVPPGRPGEPWLLTDPRTGTVLPISSRGWAGTYRPEDIGLTSWQFVLRFGAHTPGGGFGERGGSTDDATGGPAQANSGMPSMAKSPPAAEIDISDADPARAAKPSSPAKTGTGRWVIAGQLEVDCMFCHSADQQHDPAEAARQIEAQNFRWAPTAALGLAVIRGAAKKLPDNWDPEAPPSPDYPDQVPPKVVWDKQRFDADSRVFFNITRRPPVERCYFCHTVREVGPNKADDLVAPRDVHVAAGLLCVDCHRNELDHMIARGYDLEAAERKESTLAAFSCAGCHLGSPGAEETQIVLGGRYRAPHPEHRGIPPVHFEKLTCTACHSGPWPEMDAHQFQTAMAHGLGLASRDRTPEELPHVIGPVFGLQPDGKIAPQRMVWPAFWGRQVGGQIKPIPWATLERSTRGVLPKLAATKSTAGQPLPDELILWMLDALAADKTAEGVPVYVWNGTVHRRTPDGKLESIAHAAALPYLWSLAHDVRPASQSLGVRGCTDCHAGDGVIYFGRITAAVEKEADGRPLDFMYQVRGDDDVVLAQAWALGFALRPAFKWFALACAGLIALVLLRYALEQVGGATAIPVVLRPARGLTRFEHLFHTLALAGLVIQTITGFGPKLIGDEVSEWPLFIHMLGAPLFVIGLTGVALQWAGRCRSQPASAGGLSARQRNVFWLALLLGFAVMVTMLVAMLPWFGTDDQETLTEIHKYAALLLLIVMVVHTFVSLAARRARGKSS